jgi:hypothetical protein
MRRMGSVKGLATLAASILGGLGTGCGGTSGPLDAADRDLLERRLSMDEAAKLPFACAGDVTKGGTIGDGQDGSAADMYTCWPEQTRSREPLEAHDFFVDKTGALVDLEWLRERKHQKRLETHRFDQELIREAALRPTEELKVHVWFDVPEGGTLPTKAEVLTMTDAELVRATADASQALRKQADALLTAIEALPGRKQVLGMLGGEQQITPMIVLRASPEVLERIGDLEGVTEVGFAPKLDRGASSAWYPLDLGSVNGAPVVPATGAGVTVADVYGGGGFPDSTFSGLKPGSCDPPSGPNYMCYCPSAAASGSGGTHIARAMGFVKSTHPSLPHGNARGATVIVANDIDGDSCTSNSVEGGIDWALANGANVINRSASNSHAYARYLDYRATISPFPLAVAAAGNDGLGSAVSSELINGVVVGGARDFADPDRNNLKTMYSGSQSVNRNGLGAAGFEMPHIVAPAVWVSTNSGDGGVISVTGTSFSTPQVSGAAAMLMDAINTKMWPEAVFSLLMVGPEQSVDGGMLSLHDTVDDRDGVGALNTRNSFDAALIELDPGQSANRGWDVDIITKGNSPSGAYLNSGWTAVIPAGRTLRVSAMMFGRNTCTIGSASSCTGRDIVHFRLRGLENGALIKESANFNSNYQYFTYTNTSINDKFMTLKIWISNWNSLVDTTLGFAFTS